MYIYIYIHIYMYIYINVYSEMYMIICVNVHIYLLLYNANRPFLSHEPQGHAPHLRSELCAVSCPWWHDSFAETAKLGSTFLD